MIRRSVILCAWLLSATLASAQTTPSAPASTPDGGMSTKNLTVPGNGGVADTGLGGTKPASPGNGAGGASGATRDAAPGNGMSVKGEAGQGIGGKAVSPAIGKPAQVPAGAPAP